jgi:sporulation-control protein
MSFFKKMLSSVGIGSAKVDTVLQGNQFVPGDVMDAVVYLRGGNMDQEINDIYFRVYCDYIVESNDSKYRKKALLSEQKLHERFVLPAGAEEEIPVHLELPFATPITVGRSRVWVQTGLEISSAVDPSDTDYVNVVPDQYAGALFAAIESLGFVLVEAECEGTRRSYNGMPFVQEFEFKPRGGPFARQVQEVEVILLPHETGLEAIIEVDRRGRGFTGFLSEMLDTNEMRTRIHINDHNINHLTEEVTHIIESFS